MEVVILRERLIKELGKEGSQDGKKLKKHGQK